MTSLASAARLSEELYQSPTKHDFMGKIMPAEEGRFDTTYGLIELLLRVRPDCPVGAGDEMIDRMGRRFLLMDFDFNEIARSHRLIQLNAQVSWSRRGSAIDPVTRAERDDVSTDFGTIWVSMQIARGESTDSAININQDMRRVITRAHLELGDRVGNYGVERVSYPLGVTVAEVQ